MNGHEPETGELETSPAQAYFRAIEETFIELRGSPLLLSPGDWLVTRRWFEQGIPLELVEEIMRQVFERRRAQGKEKKILNLRFCRRAVNQAWERQQELAAPGRSAEVPAIDVAARLRGLAAALPSPLGDAFQPRILELEGSAEVIEDQLAALDRELLAAAAEHLETAAREQLDRELETALANLAERLPAGELEGAAGPLRQRLLRDRLAVPVLSLFAPEAAEPEAGDG